MESILDMGLAPPVHFVVESLLYMAAEVVNRVKELRDARGWTQQQLADAVGVSRQSINSIERDRYIPSLPLALTFARVFACSTEEIFTLNNDTKARQAHTETGEDEKW
jgi:putative transcriptional regulator